MTTDAPIDSPAKPKYMEDAQGRLCPESTVSEIDKLRDQTVRAIARQAIDLSACIATFKRLAFSDIDAFVQTSAEQYGVKVRGNKGRITLHTFDGRYKIMRAVQEVIRFDERLQAAKALIDECLASWSEGSSDEIKVVVNNVFRVNDDGDVRVSLVLSLLRYDIKDEKWQSAMKAIRDAIQVVGSKSYIRIYERVDATGEYKPITLDVAGV